MTLSLLRDRYLLLSEIGKGGLSTVYLGKDRTNGDAVAVKISEKSKEGALKAALNESQLLLRLKNPGIPRFVDYFEENQRCFMVTEYMEGSTVSAGMELTAVYTGMQLLMILRYLHTLDRPVLHLDIKPGNVLLSLKGKVSLVDFGSAVREGTGSFVKSGTPGYCAPEQLLGKEMDARTDIYGWGMLMRFMLSEEAPSEGLKAILDRCTARDPDLRYTDADSLLADMRKFSGNHKQIAVVYKE